MIVLEILCMGLGLYLGVVLLYLLLLTCAAYCFQKKIQTEAGLLSFGVIIPAHNEAMQIEESLQGLQACNYPEALLDVYVIADNCSDATASKAKACGAKIFERFDETSKGKGQALDWFLRRHKEIFAAKDGLIILDADTLPDQNFFQEVSASLAHPDVDVVQGFYGVSNPESNWRSALTTAALNVFHHVRPAGRNVLGGSAGLKGNGMGFSRHVLENYAWPAHGLVEDIEFSLLLLYDDIVVHYNPDAVVLAEMATERDQAATQRKRWEGGRFDLLRQYGPDLIGSCVRKRSMALFDGLMELLIPPLGLLVLLVVLLGLASVFVPYWLPVLIGGLFVLFFYVFSGLFLRRAPLSIWLSLLAVPFFLIWKIPVYLKLLLGNKKGTWERTQRQKELDNQD